VVPLLRGEAAPPVSAGDVERLADGLRRAGLSALALKALQAGSAPREFIASLERERNRQRADLTFLYDRLARFAELMDGAGVRFILLKGAALSTLLYDSLEQRPMVDVDVLVKRDDWTKARDALEGAGYHVPTESDERFWLANYYNVPVSSPDARPASFDIHWALNQEIRYSVDEAGLWERSVAFEREGKEFLRLGNEDLLLSLALHVAYHYFEARLLWLYDIHRLCRQVNLEWDAALARARQWGMFTVLGLALSYVERIFPGTAPQEVLEATAPGIIRRALLAPLRSKEPARLFLGDDTRLLQLLQGLLVMDGPARAARFGLDKVARRLRFLGTRPRLK
jgi:hypothetical protein